MTQWPALLATAANASTTIYQMYLTGQHNVIPRAELVSNITHVSLAFLQSPLFNSAQPATSWPLFTTLDDVRPKFPKTTKILVSIGGWGDDDGWLVAAATEASRKTFAHNIGAMVNDLGADGVDIDWEYPGGNGENYKKIPNSQRAWEIEAYPKLLAEIRNTLGPTKVMSAAVPGLKRDMIAFTKESIPKIMHSLDFLNVMTYDLMNRRDTVTKHHTGLSASLESIDAYIDLGVPASKLNLGFAFYVKWFKTEPQARCSQHAVGCKTALMENPENGADLGQAGAFSWHDPIPKDLETSFAKARQFGTYDIIGGGYSYWDADENRFWTWDTPDAIAKKIPSILVKRQLRGAFAWGLGEDADDFIHLQALNQALKTNIGWPSKEEL